MSKTHDDGLALTFGSLFAGIGGLDLGLDRAGMVCRWQVEWDDYCQLVLTRTWPEVRGYEDVKDCGKWNLEPVDLICGGFPCQPVSVAGQRKGAKDERWLWPEFYRIIRELRPRWVLAENVPGLLSVDDGRLMGSILRDLAESGYDAEWDCIPAAAVGAPHLRYRVFIVAYSRTMGRGTRAIQQALRSEKPKPEGQEPGQLCEVVADPQGKQSNPGIFGRSDWQAAQASLGRLRSSIGAEWWAFEPELGRVAHGIPNRVDRLRALGNAVVPQVAEWIGRRIIAAETLR